MPDGSGGYIRKSSTYTPPLGSTPTQAKRGADAYAIEFEQKCKGLTAYNENMTLDELQAWYMSDIAPNRLKNQTADVNTRFYSYYIQPIAITASSTSEVKIFSLWQAAVGSAWVFMQRYIGCNVVLP